MLIFTGTYDRYIPVMIIPFKHCTGFRLKHLIYNCKMHTLLQVQRLGKRFGSQLPGNLLGPTARPMSLDFSMFEDGKNFVSFSFSNIPQNIFPNIVVWTRGIIWCFLQACFFLGEIFLDFFNVSFIVLLRTLEFKITLELE